MRLLNDCRILLAVFSIALLPATGCRNTLGPKMPPALGAPSITVYKASEFTEDLKNYRAAIAAGELVRAKALRNQMAYRVMVDIEADYSRFEMSLTTQRAGFETGADTVQLGISAAATLVGATEVKDMLTASLTAFQGTRLSLDKNFFREKTTESIISQMRASRKTKQAELITSLGTRDVREYTWDSAWIDLVDFYYAGTVPSALVEIASSTGTKADRATTTLSNAVKALTPRTAAQAKQAVDIRSTYEKLAAEATGSDASKAASAAQTLKKILNGAGYKTTDDESAADLLEKLRAAMRAAKDDNDKLASLNAAIEAADPQ